MKATGAQAEKAPDQPGANLSHGTVSELMLRELSQIDDTYHRAAYKRFPDVWLAQFLVCADDAVIVRHLLGIIFTCCLSVYANLHFSWLAAIAFFCVFIFNGQAIATYLHASSHRKLFRKPLHWLNDGLVLVLSPWLGDPPFLFALEHVVNHHTFDNGPQDIGSTMKYQRDSVLHFFLYLLNFFFGSGGIFGLIHLLQKVRGLRSWKRKFYGGQLLFWTIFLIRLYQDWLPTVVVFLGAFVLMQAINRANNWVEHAFIDPRAPLDPTRNAYTILNSRFNAGIGGNEGYHAVHHLKPSLPIFLWPEHFRVDLQRYIQSDHLVLEKTNSFDLLFMLLLKDYRAIAKHYVSLPGNRCEEAEIVDMLKSRVKPIRVPL